VRLGRARPVAFENLAIEIDNQNIVPGDASTAGITPRNEEAIGADAR